MKILHVETGRNLYGGALQVLYLIKGLKEKSVSNTLVCTTGSRIAEAADGTADRIYSFSMRGDLDLPFIFRLAGIIRREAPDIVHLHSRRGADLLGGISSLITGSRCVLSRRVDNPEPRLWARIKYSMYDRVITISEGIKQVLLSEGVTPEKVAVVRSAVDISGYECQCDKEWFMKEFGLDEGAVPVGVVAQFIERKGHRHVIHAMPEILGRYPEVRFLFFGRGPLEDKIKQLVSDKGVSHAVSFCGFRNDLHRVLSCLFAVVHPASMEGLGVSLLQAAASCVPIAGAKVGGIPEVVREGLNGLLIAPDSPADVAEALLQFLADPQKARDMGRAGRKMVEEEFSIDAMVEGNLKVYQSLCGAGQA